MPQNHTVERVALSLPAALLRRVEALRRITGLTRSGLIREALEGYLRAARRRRRVATYLEGYARRPETRAEIAAARASAARLLASEPWE
ncbi:MAG: ribbon-helix-helix protein, CopG family [Planctomycetes bacterium]|nr:ribbon-helix-helix protein, CopG family [Planctomycetota bacterium]